MSERIDYQLNIRADRLLNAAITGTDIGASFEDHLAIFDQYYADEIQASIDGFAPVSGKAAVRHRIAAFLMPLHAFVEIGGATSSIRIEPIASDSRDETHNYWTLELKGNLGRGTVLKWRSRRMRRGRTSHLRASRLNRTNGEPLTEHDLNAAPNFPNIN